MRPLALFVLLNLNLALACGSIPLDLWILTEQAATTQALAPEFVAAVVFVESRYCPEAVSPKGAAGLGQLMPATAEMLGVDPKIPSENLLGTAAYLREQLDVFGTLELALAAYNAGPGAVMRYEGVPPYKETQAYVAEVSRLYAVFLAQRESRTTASLRVFSEAR